VARFADLKDAPGIEANEGTSWQFVELAMNCYDSPDSKGNPVLLDEQFRQAVNWAVDREKVVGGRLPGLRDTVGSTILIARTRRTEYHWEPPAESAFTYDPERANQILDDAGYADVDGDGYRETKDGKTARAALLRDHRLGAEPDRRQARSSAGSRTSASSSTTRSSTPARSSTTSTSTPATPTRPTGTCSSGTGPTDVDPNFIVDIYTPQQIEGWNDCLWTDPEYTGSNEQQKRTRSIRRAHPADPAMQEIFYSSRPYAVLSTPTQLEAYNVEDWEGWVHVPGNAIGDQSGAVLYSFNNIDTYRLVQPKVAVEEAAGGSSTTTIVVVVVAAAVIVLVLALLLARRRGARALEE
jgi:peptide/nickel transport system substrate-binding protein